MVFDNAKIGRAFNFMKGFASEVTLSFLQKLLTWSIMAFMASNFLKLAGLVANPLKKAISKEIFQYSFFYAFL